MLRIENKSECCGCSACASICSNKAIEMSPDPLGFLYPVVSPDKCNGCGLCQNVCTFNKKSYNQHNRFPKIYLARHKKLTEVENSRSGAIFVALSDFVLKYGGVVYGAAFDNVDRVVHKRATSYNERDAFRGSKYVQSDVRGIFLQVKNDLKNGKMVLFSGTPCQVSGLSSYLELLKVNTANLILIDVICHGVPSQKYWRDFLSYLSRKEKSEIVAASFRDKRIHGWASHRESIVFEDGRQVSYERAFYDDILLRRSCSRCPYASMVRTSDISIGDYWGWERVDAQINKDDKGVNLVLLNTLKGESIFSEIKSQIYYIESDELKCVQPNLLYPTPSHHLQDSFEKDYLTYGFQFAYKKYILASRRRSKWQSVKKRFITLIKRFLVR